MVIIFYWLNNIVILNLKESTKSDSKDRLDDDRSSALIFREEMSVNSFEVMKTIRIEKNQDIEKPNHSWSILVTKNEYGLS